MKRTSKRYVVTTSALNCYGYRVLTEGVELTQFLKNPILLWMHKADRSPGPYDKTIPLGRAVDVKKEGDEISCALEFSESNPFAMVVYGMYEDGTLNMLSLGATPIELSREDADLLPGQPGPTVTKSKATEFTCCDIGANDEALSCQLYDDNENKIALADLSGEGMIKLYKSLQHTNNDDNMKLIQLTGPALNGILLALKLKDDATEIQVQEKVNELIQLTADLGSQNTTLKGEKATADAKVVELQTKVDEQIKLANESKVNALVDGAVTAKKILPGQKESFIKLANADFESTKSILDGMAGSVSVKEKLELAAGETTELEGLIKLSWDVLHQSGQLERLKELNNDAFLAKRAEKYPVAANKK